MLTEKQCPYTGPYGLAGSGLKSKGPTAEALKRAMSRLGFLDWTDFDQHYNKNLAEALNDWDPGNTGYGDGRWKKIRAAKVPAGKPHAGEWALDAYAQELIQDEKGEESGGAKIARVQAALREFSLVSISHEPGIHYAQFRPVDVTVEPGATRSVDCSGFVIQAAHWARVKTGLNVPDPAKQNWSGYGNTDWYEDDWRKVGSPYRVGDLAHFWGPRHVIMCIAPGTYRTAEWVSHGQEGGPDRLILDSYSRYPSEFMFVVRWLDEDFL